MRLRRRENGGAELRDHRVDDLGVRPAEADLACDLVLHLDREGRVGLVEGRVALDADEARLEVRLAALLLARCGGRGEHERRERGDDELHDASARRMPASICCREAWPVMCGGTTLPRRSTKNVSGTPVTPHFGHVLPSASRTLTYVTP